MLSQVNNSPAFGKHVQFQVKDGIGDAAAKKEVVMNTDDIRLEMFNTNGINPMTYVKEGHSGQIIGHVDADIQTVAKKLELIG